MIFFSNFYRIAPRSKKLLSKRPREPSPEQLEFVILEHQVHFVRLSKLKFGQTWFSDLRALREIQLGEEMADEVEELLSEGSWWRLLPIREPTICMLTLEVLASFEFDQSYSSFSSIDAIQFRAFGQYHNMSVTQFAV